MASKGIVQGQEVIKCDSCQNPVSFFCRRCSVNLCDPCVPVHLRVSSQTGHHVVDFASKDFDDSNFCISENILKINALHTVKRVTNQSAFSVFQLNTDRTKFLNYMRK